MSSNFPSYSSIKSKQSDRAQKDLLSALQDFAVNLQHIIITFPVESQQLVWASLPLFHFACPNIGEGQATERKRGIGSQRTAKIHICSYAVLSLSFHTDVYIFI